jgi:hypothetical protein
VQLDRHNDSNDDKRLRRLQQAILSWMCVCVCVRLVHAACVMCDFCWQDSTCAQNSDAEMWKRKSWFEERAAVENARPCDGVTSHTVGRTEVDNINNNASARNG